MRRQLGESRDDVGQREARGAEGPHRFDADAQELIGIANPDHREGLARDAREKHLVSRSFC
jgi:hypothetical protein